MYGLGEKPVKTARPPNTVHVAANVENAITRSRRPLGVSFENHSAVLTRKASSVVIVAVVTTAAISSVGEQAYSML
eukprot:CAMPEP_0115841684 /NCGR_PEP_ID=MMETSP0287-20121206/7414_1 /TAXON_ID=412157 /ORGANISM="Chrysochromulina rotalis, Strain UIO044" /LENGTH=75 /DNA_ID=CAMNT_0003295335 /DNA_START=465 /DNA_END=695 /DNA_ORIENTATION=-